MCTCSFLNRSDFPEIARTFNEAFADYYVKMSRPSEEWLFNRAIKNGVTFDCSVGAFSKAKMVGITLIGLDDWNGVPAAFDAGTGIIPDYRGRGLASAMFDTALPRLRERGVRKFVLEVLQVNEPAIKAYRKSGFKVTREFDCFELEFASIKQNLKGNPDIRIEPVGKSQITEFIRHADWLPSWENSFSSIQRIPDDVTILGASLKGQLVGLLVYYPLLNWIVSLVVKKEHRRQGIATALLRHFIGLDVTDKPAVRLINVDHSDKGMQAFLEGTGFKLFTRQYEMELNL